MLPALQSVVVVAGGKVQPAQGQGTVVYKAPAGTETDTRTGGRIVTSATSSGIVIYRPPKVRPPTISISPSELPNGKYDVTYPTIRLVANGGTGPYIYDLAKGSLPPGLALSASGLLTGTPSQNGGFAFTVRATDSNQFTGTRTYSVSILKQEIVRCRWPEVLKDGDCIRPPTITISPSELPNGEYDRTYPSRQLVANGGAGRYRFAVSGGRLPPGLTLSASGRLAGAPSQSGGFGFTVRATDSRNFSGTRSYSVSVTDRKVLSCRWPEVLKDNDCVRPPTIAIYPSELPGGEFDVIYPDRQLVANGGMPPHTFAVTGGALPPGLKLSTTGLLTGAPSQTGAFGLTVTATDAKQFVGTRAYSISIVKKEVETCQEPRVLKDGACVMPPTIAISPSELPGGKSKATYPPAQFVANGGTSPHTFAVTGGALPPGLTLTLAGRLTGTPSQSGAFSFTVEATDSKKFTGIRAYSVSILEQSVTPCPPGATRNGNKCVTGIFGPSKTDSKTLPPCPSGTVRFGANCIKDGSGKTDTTDGGSTRSTSTDDLARPLQRQLKRLGCLIGKVDGVWGPGSRSALSKFSTRAKLKLNSLEPTQVALRAAENKRAGFCGPKPCNKGYYRNDNGQCVKESCNRGYRRNKYGNCVRIIVRCNRGYYRNDNGRCVRESCNRGYRRNNFGNCVRIIIRCNRGYQRRNGRCVPIRRGCNSNQYLSDEGRCVNKNNSEGGNRGGRNRGRGRNFQQCKRRCTAEALGCMLRYNNKQRCSNVARQCVYRYGCPEAL